VQVLFERHEENCSPQGVMWIGLLKRVGLVITKGRLRWFGCVEPEGDTDWIV